ncbi:MAG: tetratricopeptide repeat protein, partial [Bacteroidia bacterium]
MNRLKISCFFAFFLVVFSARLTAQLDSLKNVLQQCGQDTVRIRTLNKLGFMMRGSDPKQALRYVEEAKALAIKLHDERGEADSWNHIGVIYYRRGELVEASQAHIKALRIRETIGDKRGLAKSYINLGNIYSDQRNNELALRYYKQAAAKLNEVGEENGLAAIYLNIGNIYVAQKKYGLALDFFREARVRARKEARRDLEAQAITNMGVVFGPRLKRYDEALENYKEAYTIQESLGDKSGMADVAINLGEVYKDKKQYDQALVWLNLSESLSLELDYREGLRLTYLIMAEVHQNKGDFEKALNYHVRYSEIRDSLFNEENSIRMSELTERYQSERRDRELIEKTQHLKAGEEEQRKTTLMLWIIGLGALVFLAVAGFAVYAYFSRKKANEQTLRQKKSIELINEQLALKHKDMTDSIVYSRRIQQAMLPSQERFSALLSDSFVLYGPKDIVSGDFYWVEHWGEETILVVGDCTGHGVPGALLSVVGINQLNQAVQGLGLVHPGALLQSLNKSMKRLLGQTTDGAEVRDGMDVAAVAINENEQRVLFAGANRSLWLWRDGYMQIFRGDRRALGPQ